MTLGNLQHDLQPLADLKPWSAGCRLPAYHLGPRGMTVVAYVRQLIESHGLKLGERARERWQALAERIECLYPRTRRLHLFPHAQDQIPPRFLVNGTGVSAHVDLAERGVDGRSSLYQLSKVTGVDQCVQAVVACQAATADALLAAMECIEDKDIFEFCFVCHGATHRSVAGCFLLAAIAYPFAEVHLTKNRTRQSAQSCGHYS